MKLVNMEKILLMDAYESFGFRFAKDFAETYDIHLLYPGKGIKKYIESIMSMEDNFDYIINNFNIPFYSNNYEYMKMNSGTQEIINSRFKHGKKILISNQMVYSSSAQAKIESAITEPETEYGKSKLYAEKLAEENKYFLIVRSGMIYGKCTYNIYTDILTAIRGRIPLKLDNSIILNPVLNSDLALAVEKAMKDPESDIINAAAGDSMTLYQFGRRLYDSVNMDSCPFIKINTGKVLDYNIDSTQIRKRYKIKFTDLESIDFLNFMR
jgi:nucleoside-diphosphate-sugar epimerase